MMSEDEKKVNADSAEFKQGVERRKAETSKT